MPRISTLFIPDWKNENTLVDLPEPKLIGCHSLNDEKEACLCNVNLLEYFDDKAEFDVKKVNCKYSDHNWNVFTPKPMVPVKQLRFAVGANFYTTADILQTIMNTPFGDKRNWTLYASYHRHQIEIYKLDFCNRSAKPTAMLKKHFFSKKPNWLHRYIAPAYYEPFYGVYTLSVGSNNVVYSGEIAGVISESLVTNLLELNAAETVHCDSYEIGQITEEVNNFNPIWWANGTLINAKHCIIGAYNKDIDRLENVTKFNMDKFNDTTKYENLWSPTAAWNFLNLFLSFVKYEVEKKYCVRDNVQLKFECYPNDEPYIICESD